MQEENKPEIKKATKVMQMIAALLLLLLVVAGVFSFMDGDATPMQNTPAPTEKNPFG